MKKQKTSFVQYVTGNSYISSRFSAMFFAVFLMFVHAQSAFAVPVGVGQISGNIVNSFTTAPGLIAAFSYLLGLIFMSWGLIDLKGHVDNAGQTPLRKPVIKLFVGGGFISLPAIFDAMQQTIGDEEQIDYNINLNSGIGENAPNIGSNTVNQLLDNLINSVDTLPGLFTAFAYLMGAIFAISALIKLKEYVENPDNTKLSESVIRFLIGGALFALPAVMNVAYEMVSAAAAGADGDIVRQDNLLTANEDTTGGGNCDGRSGDKTGDVICRLTNSSVYFPTFLAACSYLFGIVLVIWGIFKIKDHVLNPSQTTVFEGASRIVAGGSFFSLPWFIYTLRSSLIANGGMMGEGSRVTQFKGDDTFDPTSCEGLDGALQCFMGDIFGPATVIANVFAIFLGIILIMIGISRLIKSAQDGPKGPGGLGTLMTFVIGSALVSSHSLVTFFSSSLFGKKITETNALLAFDGGMTEAELAHAHTVISAILKFLFVVGIISFIRGLYIVRGVAEGAQNSSMMAGLTHIIGGALAINLGPLIEAVQATLNLTGLGISFS